MVLPAVRVSTCPVPNNLHPTNHLTEREETNDLSGNDTGAGELLLVDVPYPGKDGFRAGGAWGGGSVEEGTGVLGCVDDGLEVGLESGHVAGIS